nr:hypothetical protein [Variovorax boronicumulans]
MADTRIESRVERQIFRDRIAVYLVLSQPQHKGRALARPLTFDVIEPGQVFGEPTIDMATEDAQQLMDELWRAGLRPTEGTGSAGSLAATERHLKDMQRIAFHLLPAQAGTPPAEAGGNG